MLADILGRLKSKQYDHGDAWVLGRLGAGAADSLWARFLSADSEEFRVRYLTLLSYFTDPALIPFLARVYAAPDSFGLPKRYAIRASDGLLWIGTRESLQALLDARAAARARGVYDDPQPAPRRPRLPRQRQLVGDQPDGEVADGVGGGAGQGAAARAGRQAS